LNLDAWKIKIPVRRPGRDFPANCFVARFTQLSNGFWHISSGCQRAGPPVLQKGEQTIANYSGDSLTCQHQSLTCQLSLTSQHHSLMCRHQNRASQ
jgi:hypothetical protein